MGAKARPFRLPTWHLRGDMSLRPLRPSDKAALFGLVEANRPRLARWFDWEEHTNTPDDVARFLDGTAVEHAAGTAIRFGVLRGGALAGLVGLEDIKLGNRSAFFGYWLDAGAEGHGLMTTAVRTLCGYAFTKLNLHRLEIQAATDNYRSRAVAERLGFQYEGVLRDKLVVRGRFLSHAVYSMLRPEWRG